MATVASETSIYDHDDDRHFVYFPRNVVTSMNNNDAKAIFDPSQHELSCSLTIAMVFFTMIFAFGALTSIYWLTGPAIRWAISSNHEQIILLYFLYIPTFHVILWLISVLYYFKLKQNQYRHYDSSLNSKYILLSYTPIIYILCIVNPVYFRLKFIIRCISYCRMYQSTLYYSINSFIHQIPNDLNEITKRIITIHYYLLNRYYELYIKHIVPTLKDGNGVRYSRYRIISTIEKFETGIKDFKQAIFDERFRTNDDGEILDAIQLAKDIEKKLKYQYDKKVVYLFPLYELVINEVELNMSQIHIELDVFSDICKEAALKQNGAFREVFMSLDYLPYTLISVSTFLSYWILNLYIIWTKYDDSESLLPVVYDFVMGFAAVGLYFLNKKYLIHNTLMYVVRFYADWSKIEDMLIIKEHETLSDIYQQYICPIYGYYAGRFMAIQLTMDIFGEDIASIIIQFIYGNDKLLELRKNRLSFTNNNRCVTIN